MTDIPRLTDSGRDMVEEHDEFTSREEVRSLRDDLEAHVEYDPVPEANIDVDALNEAIERATTVFNPDIDTQRSAMDSVLSPLVHQYYEIPPRVAGQIGVWQYLALVEFPDYVVTRWLGHGDLKEKLLGEQNDLYSNQMARLWWGAHLTYDREADHYYGTHKMFNKQRIANYVLDSEFNRCRPAVLAFVGKLHSESGTTIGTVGRRFNQSLSTYQMDSRSRQDFEDQLDRILDFVTT
ncbi:hypothetical protein AArc1_3333 [Natrarchaeobaculum sulfurireducens]|uniref:Uncharacterized protein n=2 Tax=Natrarchaeobaculum sulfurireducens TaxID=2044521 RepID=A0A346PJD8_9EURY|nr:hypothetical protein AArc1_3333 [Natrarchaeobaculum sulfurireducens]